MNRRTGCTGIVLGLLCALVAACGDGGSVARYRATYGLVDQVSDLRSLVAEVNYGDGVGPFSNAVGEPMTCRPLADDLLIAVSDEGLGVASLHLLSVGAPCEDCETGSIAETAAGIARAADRPLFECDLDLQGAVRVENFAARTLFADDSAGGALDPLPDLAVDFIPGGSGAPSSDEDSFAVRFAVPQTALVGSLQFDAVFSGPGDWRDGDRCSFKVAAALATCNAKGGGVLTCGLASAAGLQTPGNIVDCELDSSGENVTTDQITVIVVGASDPSARPIDVDVEALVAPEPGDTAPPAADDPVYEVAFSLASDIGNVGALHFEVDYAGERGGWTGSGAGVECQWLIGTGVSACSDAGGGHLNCAFASVDGVTTPTDIVRCGFAASAAPLADSFAVRTVAATDPDFGTLVAVVSVDTIAPREEGAVDATGWKGK